jgi:methionyl-tRNA synthetase
VPKGLAKIAIDDFAKVELRVAEVTACERVVKSKKLLKLTLDVGGASRTVVSGIAQWYSPEQLMGKKVIVVANLAPAKLCGVESNGMILAADIDEGGASVLFIDPSVPSGAKIR